MMQFLVQFADGTKVWKFLDKDLSDTQQFAEFCRQHRQLLPILMTNQIAGKYIRDLKKKPITLVEPGDSAFVDLRSWGSDNEGLWYDNLPLPDKYDINYVVRGTYISFINSKHLRIRINFPVFNETHVVDNVFVNHYGYSKNMKPNSIEVDKDFVRKFPEITK
jgi:hypothetical protein